MRMFFLLASLAVTSAAGAAVQSRVVEYDAGGTKSKGFLVYDDAAKTPAPGIVVFHEWYGLNEHAKERATRLAKLGYVAFCADLYGDGKTTEHPKEAGEFATKLRSDEKLWSTRAKAAVKTLKEQKGVNPEKIAAIGFCFGGTTALNLAFAGEDLKAVAVFHAGLPKVTAEQAANVKCPILVAHGGADTFIPAAAIDGFRKALDTANKKYEFDSYPGVTHSFTVEHVDKKMPGLKYDADADHKSWDKMTELFKRTLGS